MLNISFLQLCFLLFFLLILFGDFNKLFLNFKFFVDKIKQIISKKEQEK